MKKCAKCGKTTKCKDCMKNAGSDKMGMPKDKMMPAFMKKKMGKK